MANSFSPRVQRKPVSELRGYFMRHKTGGDVGFAWHKDDPLFSDDWERIPAAAAEPMPASEAPKPWQERIKEDHPNSDPQYWPESIMLKNMNAEIAEWRTRAAAPVPASEAASLLEFVEAIAGPTFTYTDRETDESCCNGCNMAAEFISIDEGFRQPHAHNCIVLRARAYLAAPAAPTDANTSNSSSSSTAQSVRDAAPAAGPAFKERRRFEERG